MKAMTTKRGTNKIKKEYSCKRTKIKKNSFNN